MFKNYLRVLPKGVQISIFFGMWVALFMVGSMVGGLVQTNLFGIPLEEGGAGLSQYPQVSMVLNVVLQVFMFGLPALLFAYLSDPNMKRYLGFREGGKILNPIVLLLLSGLMIFFISSLAGLIKTIDLGTFANELQTNRDSHIQTYLKNSSWQGVLIALVLMAVVPAICEELFFRGVFMKIMLNVNKSSWMAFVFTSLFFTLLHSSVYEFLPIFLASMILCFLYYYTGNIVNTIVLHFLNNGIQVLLVLFSSSENEIANTWSDKLLLVGILVATSVGLYLILQQLYKKYVPEPQHWNMQYIQHLEK